VPTFRTEPPRHREPLRRLVDHLAKRQVDALVLTSPSCAEVLIEQATRDGILDEMLNAIVADVGCFCLGPLTARPLIDRGLNPAQPARPRQPELSTLVVQELPARATIVTIGGHEVQIRGQALVVGQTLIPVQPGPVAVLRALAGQPGRVMSPTEIRQRVAGWSEVDDHAIEMAVSRLRRCLDGTALNGLGLVQTVMRRGYRLAI
jgi:uroporphyrinogen-III synthase